MIKRIKVLKEIGRFSALTPTQGTEGDFSSLNVIYAGNACGKSTLCDVFRSLDTGNPDYVIGRKRIGANTQPEVVMIRDHLHACHLYYTSNSILIRPLIAPTKSFAPFQNARQRIYMSATLGEGGDLERIFGRKKIERLPAPEGWDKQGIGRRFFVFPMRNVDEAASLSLAISWTTKFDRALVLTPRNRDADKVREAIGALPATQGHTLFDAAQLEASKKSFTQAGSAIAVLANRYDGIDLIGDECRYLIIYGLPESTNLQERFIISRLGASVLFQVRIRTRVTQAVGRCTRSSTDYALVVIIGDKVHQFFHMKTYSWRLCVTT